MANGPHSSALRQSLSLACATLRLEFGAEESSVDELSAYLSNEYRRDVAGGARLKKLARPVVETLMRFAQDGSWLYELVDGAPPKYSEDYLYSTNTMILHSLAAVAGALRGSALVPGAEGWLVDPKLVTGDKGLGILNCALDRLADNCANGEEISKSDTFGTDDPLTLARILEIDRVALEATASGSEKRIHGFDSDLRKKLAERVALRISVDDPDHIFDMQYPRPHADPQPVSHAFPYLSQLHMAEAFRFWYRRRVDAIEQEASRKPLEEGNREKEQLKSESEDGKTAIDSLRQKGLQFFLERLYRHLSSSLLPDSGFDAAELVFSLEGMLLCGRFTPHRELVGKVFEILRERQSRSPYWRPSRPFQATPQGMVQMPVSVEIANSLLRVCCHLDRGNTERSYFSENIELFRRYADWILSHVDFGEAEGGKQFCGWHSEHVGREGHVGKEGRVHLWETSQVLLFLVQYSGLLRWHVARTGLEASRLRQGPHPAHEPRAPRQPATSVGGGGSAPPGYSGWSKEKQKIVETWGQVEKKMEPLKGLDDDSPYRVYRVAQTYVTRHAPPPAEGERPYSILLYGPPGTGKSTFADKLAHTLSYRLVTVTPSDFLAAGPADVERRAKDLFDLLQWQSETVILFDEIDHFLLDRESELYRQQTGIFQFLTPGMLNKINDLHLAKRPIFIIATNYFERIDGAIRRAGRIDDHLLLMPPDSMGRKAILEDVCGEESKRIKEWATNSDEAVDASWQGALGELVAGTKLWVYGEFVQLVRAARAAVSDSTSFDNALRDSLHEVQPTITLRSYKSRFNLDEKDDFRTVQEPFEEFYLLAYLVWEDWRQKGLEHPAEALSARDRDLVLEVARREAKDSSGSLVDLSDASPPQAAMPEETPLAAGVKDAKLRKEILTVISHLWQAEAETS